MASVCYAFGLSPQEYRTMTLAEHRAFVDLLKKLEKERG